MLFVSQLSDMFGRRTVFVTAFWIGAALGSASALVPSHTSFVVIRFMQGVFAVVIYSIVHSVKEKRFYSGPFASVLGVLHRVGNVATARYCAVGDESVVVCIPYAQTNEQRLLKVVWLLGHWRSGYGDSQLASANARHQCATDSNLLLLLVRSMLLVLGICDL